MTGEAGQRRHDDTPHQQGTAATYGPPPRRWVVGVLAGVLLTGLTAWVVWAGLAQEATTVQSNVLAYQVLDDDAVQVRYQVVRDPMREVRCTLEAQNTYHEPIGRVDVSVPAGEPRAVERRDVIRTTERAVTALVAGCRYLDG